MEIFSDIIKRGYHSDFRIQNEQGLGKCGYRIDKKQIFLYIITMDLVKEAGLLLENAMFFPCLR